MAKKENKMMAIKRMVSDFYSGDKNRQNGKMWLRINTTLTG
jgi:hypothetical protein